MTIIAQIKSISNKIKIRYGKIYVGDLQMEKENIFKSIGLAILLYCINALFLGIAQEFSPYLVSSYVLSYGAMVILLVKCFKKDILDDLKNLLKDFKENYKAIIPVSTLCIISVYILNAILLNFIGSEAGNQVMATQELKSSIILMSLHLIILAPITEELIFKLPFKHNKKRRLLNFFIITIMFTLIHIYPESNPLAYLYLISYLLLSISFTYPFYKTNNILMSIIIHIINNLINVMIILF